VVVTVVEEATDAELWLERYLPRIPVTPGG